MTIATGKEVHEWAQECLEICEAVESQLSSTIYRTETSRWWAVTNELSKLTHKLAVIKMKLFFDKSKGLPAGRALRFVSETMQSAMTAYSHMYHREVLSYEGISQHCKGDCKKTIQKVKKELEVLQKRCS